MATIITFGLQKGGVAKTTTTGALAHLLSEDKKRVLAVDMDSQGNLTELLADVSANEFNGRSVLEAIAYKNPEEYIYSINEYLDLLPANNFLASLARWTYTKRLPNVDNVIEYTGSPVNQLNLTLNLIEHKYDYILIDTPPSLSEQTTNSLMASDYVIIPFESSKFCYSALPNFLESVEFARKHSERGLEILGILRGLNDARRSDSKFFIKKVSQDYPDLCFDTILTRKATTGRLSLYGFSDDNEEIKDALSQFKSFYKEFIKKIEGVRTYE